MSTYISLKSVCGNSSASVDIYDLDLNPHGVICCGNCESILVSRKSWEYEYKGAN